MRKLVGTVIVVSVMLSIVACGKDDDKSESTITTDVITSGENVTEEEDTSESKSENSDGLSEEELLALPESDAKDFYYKEVEGGILLDGYWTKPNKETIMVLPNQIDGKEVVELDVKLFFNRYAKAVVINKNNKEIPYQCFQSSHIEKIILPEGLESISMDAFYLSHTEEIKLPSTLKTISSDAFGSSAIKEITIPKNVEIVSTGAFSLCSNLELVTFEGCPKVSSGAFLLSSNIKRVICLDGNITFADDEFYDASDWNEAGEGETVDITFVAPAGSKVEQYAKDRGFKFEALD